tara:strand:+ start:823 stop:1290 length:468 start_codon:yes stop_codon:yes gene_type:complete
MDPLSLIAMASTTFKGIQTLVNQGAEIEAVAQKLGSWYSFAADIKQVEEEAGSPGAFKRLFQGQSVEQQALNSLVASRKLAEQEKQVRELIVWTYGVEAYQEMIMLRRKIKKQREDAIYKRRKRKQKLLDALIITAGVVVSSGVVYGTVIFIKGA